MFNLKHSNFLTCNSCIKYNIEFLICHIYLLYDDFSDCSGSVLNPETCKCGNCSTGHINCGGSCIAGIVIMNVDNCWANNMSI